MAIHFVTGKPGAGKGMLAMQMVVDELREGTRPICTNLAIELHPWVNGKWQPQKGLLAGLMEKYGTTFNAEHRVFRLTDDEASTFYLYRPKFDLDKPRQGDKVGYTMEVAAVTSSRRKEKDGKHGKVIIEEFDTRPFLNGPTLNVIDECWKFWGSRNWQYTGEALQFYCAQNRKTGDDTLVCTQNTGQVDAQLRPLAQDFWVCRNRSKMRMGMFKQPKDIYVDVYSDPQVGTTTKSQHHFTMEIDAAFLGQCYDTSGGVGLSGRMGADIGKKLKGIPFKYLIIGMVVLPLLLGAVAWKALKYGVNKAGHSTIHKKETKTTNPFADTNSMLHFFPDPHGSGQKLHSVSDGAATHTNESVYITGMFNFPGSHHVVWFLSDGTKIDSTDPALTYANKRGVKYKGQAYVFR